MNGVGQVNGMYRVNNARLKRYYNTVLQLLREFRRWQVVHVPREANAEADALANRRIDEKPVDDITPEILQRCRSREGAIKYILEKRCEGVAQLRFILDAIRTNFPDSYAAVQQRCVQIRDEMQINDYNVSMASLLAEY
jgi:hypothetical protein